MRREGVGVEYLQQCCNSRVCGGVSSRVCGGVSSRVCGGASSRVWGGVSSRVCGGVSSRVCGGVGCVVVYPVGCVVVHPAGCGVGYPVGCVVVHPVGCVVVYPVGCVVVYPVGCGYPDACTHLSDMSTVYMVQGGRGGEGGGEMCACHELLNALSIYFMQPTHPIGVGVGVERDGEGWGRVWFDRGRNAPLPHKAFWAKLTRA